MKILVVNAGSSSLKYQLFDMPEKEPLAKGLCNSIGEHDPATGKLVDGKIKHTHNGETYEEIRPIANHDAALARVLELLTDEKLGVIGSIDEIAAVGHRFAHGGEKLRKSTVLGEKEIEYIRSIVPINPLHGPGSLAGVEACKKVLPNVPHVGVFDTAFHSTIPDYAYIYPLPYEWYEKYMVRRYGFHGTSHRYVSGRVAELMGRKPEDLKIIVCHLGNGSSITAVDHGKVVDTSMGFTPQEGVPMGTRSGSIDPTIVTYMMKQLGKTPEEMDAILNKESGLLGISGVSSDCYKVMINKDPALDYRAKLAINVLCYDIKKIIGSYIAAMNGVDAIAFTAGIGENDREIRRRLCENMDYLGIRLNEDANAALSRGEEGDITAPDSRVRLFSVPTNEEYMIALDTQTFIS